jgi:alkylated DNA repair dioxygenase AlkB
MRRLLNAILRTQNELESAHPIRTQRIFARGLSVPTRVPDQGRGKGSGCPSSRPPLQGVRISQLPHKRRVVSFGWKYDFSAGKLRESEPTPEFIEPIREKAAEFADIEPQTLAHVLVTEYSPGTTIGWHRDRPQYEDVIGISLGSECVFRLRRKAGSSWQRRSITLAPRSVYALRGPVRNEWEHSIPAVARLRYSITFRDLRVR